jgi:hypothetical protein
VIAKLFNGIIIAARVLIGLLFGVPILLWLTSFIDRAPEQDNCAFGSVTQADYRPLLGEAKAQSWTVWQGLSNGVLFPSDRGIRTPSPEFQTRQSELLLRSFQQLTASDKSSNGQLAAAHALMRSVRAEYVNTSYVRDYERNRSTIRYVSFGYLLPQARFAPLCLFCAIWPTVVVFIPFQFDNGSEMSIRDGIRILFPEVGFSPGKMRNTSESCPKLLPASTK